MGAATSAPTPGTLRVPACAGMTRRVAWEPSRALGRTTWASLVRAGRPYGVTAQQLRALFHQRCSPEAPAWGVLPLESLLSEFGAHAGALQPALLAAAAAASAEGGSGVHAPTAQALRFEDYARAAMQLCGADLLAFARALATAAPRRAAATSAGGVDDVRSLLRIVRGGTRPPVRLAAEVLARLHDSSGAPAARHDWAALEHLLLRYPVLALPVARCQEALERTAFGRAHWLHFRRRAGNELFAAPLTLHAAVALTARCIMLEAVSTRATPFAFGTDKTRMEDDGDAAPVPERQQVHAAVPPLPSIDAIEADGVRGDGSSNNGGQLGSGERADANTATAPATATALAASADEPAGGIATLHAAQGIVSAGVMGLLREGEALRVWGGGGGHATAGAGGAGGTSPPADRQLTSALSFVARAQERVAGERQRALQRASEHVPGASRPLLLAASSPPPSPPRRTSAFAAATPAPHGAACSLTSLEIARVVHEHAQSKGGALVGVVMSPCLLCGCLVQPRLLQEAAELAAEVAAASAAAPPATAVTAAATAAATLAAPSSSAAILLDIISEPITSAALRDTELKTAERLRVDDARLRMQPLPHVPLLCAAPVASGRSRRLCGSLDSSAAAPATGTVITGVVGGAANLPLPPPVAVPPPQLSPALARAMRQVHALDLPPPPPPPPLRHDALLEFEAREAELEDAAVDGVLCGWRDELQGQELAALDEAVKRDLAVGWLQPPPPLPRTAAAPPDEQAHPPPPPLPPPPLPGLLAASAPQPAKLANTGFCADCDGYIARVLADLCGYKLSALILAAAEAAPSTEDALRLSTLAARADGQPLGGGGGDGARRPGDAVVRLLDERSGRAFSYNAADGGAQWEDEPGGD